LFDYLLLVLETEFEVDSSGFKIVLSFDLPIPIRFPVFAVSCSAAFLAITAFIPIHRSTFHAWLFELRVVACLIFFARPANLAFTPIYRTTLHAWLAEKPRDAFPVYITRFAIPAYIPLCFSTLDAWLVKKPRDAFLLPDAFSICCAHLAGPDFIPIHFPAFDAWLCQIHHGSPLLF
jgi:hypothetical protein